MIVVHNKIIKMDFYFFTVGTVLVEQLIDRLTVVMHNIARFHNLVFYKTLGGSFTSFYISITAEQKIAILLR